MKRLLLIEDEDVIRRALTRLLERHRYEITAVGDIDATAELDLPSFDLVLADLRLPGRDGTAIIPLAAPVPVVIMTSHASVRSAVDAMRAGASDYIAKPFDHDELLLVLERAFNRNQLLVSHHALARELARAEPAAQRLTGTTLEHLAAAINEDQQAATALRPTPMHIHGEFGSGREDLARVCHANSEHASAALFVIDSTPSGLPDSFDGARGGTLIVRHPEQLPSSTQEALAARLTAALETTAKSPSAPFLLITIAEAPIAALVEDGRLCDALARHLGEYEYHVPPLRERRTDVALMANRAAHAFGERHAGRPAVLSPQTLHTLAAGELDGNIAGLERRIELAVLESLSQSDTRSDEPLMLPDEAFGTRSQRLEILDLDGYFRYVVLELQDFVSETELATRLGMSRKALWERRHRMGLPRPPATQKTAEE